MPNFGHHVMRIPFISSKNGLAGLALAPNMYHLVLDFSGFDQIGVAIGSTQLPSKTDDPGRYNLSE